MYGARVLSSESWGFPTDPTPRRMSGEQRKAGLESPAYRIFSFFR
jgi:hypothetical protein